MSKIQDINLKEAFKLAVANHGQNKIKEAQILYNKILEVNPNHSPALNNLGVIFKNLGEIEKAKDCYKKAIEVDPNDADTNYNLGVIFQELGEYQKAKGCYEKVIEIKPDYINALNNLSVIFKNMREYQKAKDCLKRITQLNPKNTKAHNNLGIIFSELGEYQKAKSCYEKILEINPNLAYPYNNIGVIYSNLGDLENAISFYEKAIKIDTNLADPHNNLGAIHADLGDLEKAISCYKRAIELNSEYDEAIFNLASIFRIINFSYFPKKQIKSYKELFMILFRNNSIKHSDVACDMRLFFFSELDDGQLQQLFVLKSLLLTNKFIQNFLKEELLHLMLQKSLISLEFIEKLLTKIRHEVLFTLNGANKDILNEHFNFIISLAEQSWLNEYVYVQSEKEINLVNKLKQKIENDEKINELEIAILGCYIPLNSSRIITIKLLNHKSSNILFNDLIDVQIKDPLREIEITKSIKSLDIIEDTTSNKVREQYEEHPYPRWRHTSKYISSQFSLIINKGLRPNKIDCNDKFNNPNVLIAGCGTGSHPISATRYENADILAVDLSLTSLAYAKRKTEELNIKNIEYLQADILQLNKLDKKFDIIESSGVLHHMRDPIEGLKVLLNILEPHGFLKLGLYSEIARRDVVKARELIKKKKYNNPSKDIKICRQDIINQKEDPLLKKLTSGSEFYSMSTVRDLLFHVQEHRFTIPQISKILKDFDLEFLGFNMINPKIKIEYSKLFPYDKNNISLDNWHQFEINNPDIFAGMYQFWVRKI